jgi:serine-type D-Ala-D-Ala carboxypeptidase/endopeptidase (penicillin-binding protein 4)
LLKTHFICALMRTVFYFSTALLFLLLSSCATLRSEQKRLKKIEKEVSNSAVFSKGFTGFVLMEPESGKILAAHQHTRYFVPASNTKILTLAAALPVLGDSLSTFEYAVRRDTLYVIPSGDPTFLHPHFAAWQSGFQYLQKHPVRHMVVCNPAPALLRYGPGWMWDDFMDEYSPERSALTAFGNVRRITAVQPDSLRAEPSYWNVFLQKKDKNTPKIQPILESNTILYNPKGPFAADYEAWVPVYDAALHNQKLLADTLKRPLFFTDKIPAGLIWKTHRSAPIDTIYRRLMHQSDNFFAEQLLYMSARAQMKQPEAAAMVDWMQKNPFSAFPFPPKWVDGSGLSRYNLNTPLTNAQILQHLWKTQPQPRLFNLFPAGGISGTIADWYGHTPGKPFVFAKTGSMSAVHCLSGYVVDKKGKVLIFSFMHNNFIGSSKAWKEEMQRILYKVAGFSHR